jgi:hypothetical protein
MFGFSPSYLPSWVIAQFTDSPWRFITALSLLTCFLTGVFVILFCWEIKLSPLAALIGSSLATSPPFMYWLTFPMFLAVWCWATGALWAVTRLDRNPDLVGWSVLTFSIYSLLMTGYPQFVVYHAYILAGYGLYLAYRKQQLGWLEVGRFMLLSASALIVGAALALPVYIDLANTLSESLRVAPEPSFFSAILPSLGTLNEIFRFILLIVIPEIFGNPIDSSYPFTYDGSSVTPLFIFFATIGLVVSFRKSFGWLLAVVILLLLTIIHPLHALGVKYFGFNISRTVPLSCFFLPLTIIVVYGADALVKRSIPGELSRVVWLAAATVLAVIVVGLGFGLTNAIPIRWGIVLGMLILVALFVAQNKQTHPALLIAALFTVMMMDSYPLMLHQNPARIATTSPVVEKIRANLPSGSRFAVIAPGSYVLPPNLNAGLGLPSIHSYNSLSSRRYHTLIKSLGGEMLTYGRWNGYISPDFNSEMFWISNTSLLLSHIMLTHENLEYLGVVSDLHLYKVISRMGDSLQFRAIQTKVDIDGLQITDPRLLPRYNSTKVLDQGDLLEFVVTPGIPSVLMLSQMFHRDWEAQQLGKDGWVQAKTTAINGVFQGVFLSQDAQRVRLEFKPYARYALIANFVWLILLAIIMIKRNLHKTRI